MALLGSEALRIDSHINPILEKFQWPAIGSMDYMRRWNFDEGITRLQARTYRYGYQTEAAPLSPKSRLVHIALEESAVSPKTVLSRKPIYDDVESRYTKEYSDDLELGVFLPFDTFATCITWALANGANRQT